MADRSEDEASAWPLPSAWVSLGQRNILYLLFVSLLGPFGLALEGRRLSGTDSLGGIAFALMLCMTVSAGFFAINAGLVVVDLRHGRRTAKAMLGCALPLIFGLAAVVMRRMWW